MDIHSHLHILDFIVVALYLFVLVGLGAFISFRKRRTSGNEYFLAGNSLKWYSIGFTMWGTNVGPSMLIASCAIGYTTGIVAGNFSWYAFVFICLLAMVFAPHYKFSKISTLPEFMGKRFNPTTRKILAWYTLATILISWLGLTLYAGGLLVGQIMDWPLWLSVCSLMVLASFFAIAGGLEAIALTNVFQMLLLIVASGILVVAGLMALGDISVLASRVPPNYWNLFLPMNNPDYPWLAIVLGYPVLGVWFYCTDQSMVQSVLGAKNLNQGQLGTNFGAWLKILDVPLFILPGVLCYLLFPGLGDENEAYMTMVTGLLPIGLVGLIMAVLIAALVSTIDSALNSFSTIFTMDIYSKRMHPQVNQKKLVRVGRTTMLLGGIIAIFIALGLDKIKGMDLFSLFQAILGYLAPPMTATFLLGIFWKHTSAKAANIGLTVGSLVSLAVGALQLLDVPNESFWPHFLFVSFLLCVFIMLLMILVSIIGVTQEPGKILTISESYRELGYKPSKQVKTLWLVLFLVMMVLYWIFN